MKTSSSIESSSSANRSSKNSRWKANRRARDEAAAEAERKNSADLRMKPSPSSAGISGSASSSTTQSRKSKRNANRQARKKADVEAEKAKLEADLEAERKRLADLRLEEERLSRLSLFERIIPKARFAPTFQLSEEERIWGVFVEFDFENALWGFPNGYDMMHFREDIQDMLRRRFKKNYTVLGVFGAGTLTSFDSVRNFEKFSKQNNFTIKELPNRWGLCGECNGVTTPGRAPPGYISKMPHERYERSSDRACDEISLHMSSYPTLIGLPKGLSCNVLVISGDRDLGSAMRTLRKDRNVYVMLAYPGGSCKKYLIKSANHVIDFERDMRFT